MTNPTDKQIESLPRWARRYIKTLEMRLDEQRSKIDVLQGREKSPYWYRDTDLNSHFIPTHEVVAASGDGGIHVRMTSMEHHVRVYFEAQDGRRMGAPIPQGANLIEFFHIPRPWLEGKADDQS